MTAGIAGVSQVRDLKYRTIDSRFGEIDYYTQSLRDTTVGFSVGGGLEYALNDRWSAKVEYTGIILPKDNFLNKRHYFGYSLPIKTNSTLHMARVGASYKF